MRLSFDLPCTLFASFAPECCIACGCRGHGPILDLNDANQAFELTRPLARQPAAVPASRQQEGSAMTEQPPAGVAVLVEQAAALVIEPQVLVSTGLVLCGVPSFCFSFSSLSIHCSAWATSSSILCPHFACCRCCQCHLVCRGTTQYSLRRWICGGCSRGWLGSVSTISLRGAKQVSRVYR